MIELHYWTTPNGHRITIFLEESGLPYRIVPVNISAGDQFADPNAELANQRLHCAFRAPFGGAPRFSLGGSRDWPS